MDAAVVDGDLLDQSVDVIVNTWNRNIIPWWFLVQRACQAQSSVAPAYAVRAKSAEA